MAQEETDLRGLGKQMSVRLKEKEDTGAQDFPPSAKTASSGEEAGGRGVDLAAGLGRSECGCQQDRPRSW